MHGPFAHEFNLFFVKLVSADDPWISVSNLFDLFVESIFKFGLYPRQTSSSRWMSNNQDPFESWILNVIFPNKLSVRFHSTAVRDPLFRFRVWTQVWVHYQNCILIHINSPIDLWEHTTQLVISIDANRPGPVPRSDGTRALNQN